MARTETEHEAKRTTDCDEIRRWAEERDGIPAAVRSTMTKDDPGILRIDFADPTPDEELEPIPWEVWCRALEEKGLELLYQERTAGGGVSRFFKIVRRGTDEEHG